MPNYIDLYEFLKLKDKSEQLFVENNPHIYIYGDIIINMDYEHPLKLKSPDIESFFMQLGGIKPAKGTMFAILDSAGNRIYTEAYLQYDGKKDYDYSVLETNDDGWLIKTHRRNTYVEWDYDIENNQVVATTYKKDGTLLTSIQHPLDQINHIIKKKKLVDNN